MSKLLSIFSITTLLFVALGCKKEAPKSKLELLCGVASKTWKISSGKSCTGTTLSFNTHELGIRETYFKDNTLKITYSDTNAILTGNWYFMQNDTKLVHDYGNGTRDTVGITVEENKLIFDSCLGNTTNPYKTIVTSIPD